MSETIKCGNCGKDSGIERDESDGRNAAAVQRIGWIPKLPVLVGIPEWLFSCSPECKSELFQKKCAEFNVSDEQIAKAKQKTDDFKARIPEMAKETCEFMSKVQKVLKGEKQ